MLKRAAKRNRETAEEIGFVFMVVQIWVGEYFYSSDFNNENLTDETSLLGNGNCYASYQIRA